MVKQYPPETLELVAKAADVLRAGGLVAFPTETVYGLGADATNEAAVAKVFAVKGRPATNPLIVHVADARAAGWYAAVWPEKAERLAKAFWPGPLTIVLPRRTDMPKPIVPIVTAGLASVGLRCPDHPLAYALLMGSDLPLAAPSANRSNRVSPTTAQHVRDELGDDVDMILDGGPCRVGIESTVIDLSGPPAILRPGGISRERIEDIIGPVQMGHHASDEHTASTSPGQLPVHYAPRTPAFRFDITQRALIHPETGGKKNGMLVMGSGAFKEWGTIVAMPRDPEQYARQLYRLLREFDVMDLNAIYIEMPPDDPAWVAVRDRLIRATKPLPV